MKRRLIIVRAVQNGCILNRASGHIPNKSSTSLLARDLNIHP
jgi:hypothetical protein